MKKQSILSNKCSQSIVNIMRPIKSPKNAKKLKVLSISIDNHQSLLITIFICKSFNSAGFTPSACILMELSRNIEQVDRALQDDLQKSLKGTVEDQYVTELSKSLFPCPALPNDNVYGSLLKAMSTYYLIKINKNTSIEDVNREFSKKCEEIGHGLEQIRSKLVEGDFFQRFSSKFSNAKENKKTLLGIGTANTSKQGKQEKTNSDVVVIGSKVKDSPKQSTQAGSLKSNKSKQRHTNTHHKQRNISNGNGQSDDVNNVAHLGVCICEKVVSQKEKDSFLCVHCNHHYHRSCMKKKQQDSYCSMCHLKYMLPNRQVVKVLFMGLLKKSKKKHEFTIKLMDEDISSKNKLHIRCIRLKDNIQYFLQFPDYTNIMLNNYSVKEFMPLHRHSSLKYRKDEPCVAQIKHLVLKDNKVVIHQKFLQRQNKDDRIETENHLIGFFMVEEKKVMQLVQEIQQRSITTFEESKRVLMSHFPQSKNDEVSCQVIKIPLSCTLTTKRITMPVRSIFCKHFHCLDLYNFLLMTSSSTNPKWICPICKHPSYQFKIDCILLAILEAYTQEQCTQVMFFKTGDFTVHAGDRLIEGKVNNIHNLAIEFALKRVFQPPAQQQKKRRRRKDIPDGKTVIDLD